MTDRLFDVLSRRYANRDKRFPWVFWHRYWSRKISDWTVGPFKERKMIGESEREAMTNARFESFSHTDSHTNKKTHKRHLVST